MYVAVAIFTLVSRPQLPLSTILVLQFRPPVNSIVVELPAGLIDENESAETAALRESVADSHLHISSIRYG
jgi:ADP-ribose pyrophosphatase